MAMLIYTRFIWSKPSEVDHVGKRLHWQIRIIKDTRFAVGNKGILYHVNALCLDNGAKTDPTEHRHHGAARARAKVLAEVIGGYIKTVVDDAPGFTRIVRRTTNRG